MALHLVATLTLGGRTWRLAREDFALRDDDGARVEVLGHWNDPAITLELALFDVATPPEVVIDGAYLPDVGEVLKRHAWSEGRAEVALVDDTASWDARRVLLRGGIPDARTLPGDVAAFTIAADVAPPTAQVGEYVVDTARWSQPASKAQGSPVPLVFGPAGAVVAWDGTATARPASPAPYLDGVNRRVGFAAGVVEEGDVTVLEPESGSSTTVTVSHRTDGQNARIATGVLPNSSPWNDSSLQFYAAWDDTSRGLIAETSPGGAIVGLGDLALWLLRRSSVQWDRDRWLAARETLNAYRVGGAVEQPVDPWAYLIDAVLPLAPMSLIVGPEGVYPIVHRPEPTKQDATILFTAQSASASSIPGIPLVECLEDATEGVWTPTHRLRYAYDSAERDFRRQVEVSGDIGRRGDADVITTVHSLRAGARHLSAQVGRRYPEAMAEDTLESDLVTENRTAQLVVLWRSAMRTQPARRLRYAAGADVEDIADRLLGAEVLVTDKDRDLDGALAIVERVELVTGGPSPVIVTLWVYRPYDTAA